MARKQKQQKGAFGQSPGQKRTNRRQADKNQLDQMVDFVKERQAARSTEDTKEQV